MNKLYEEQSVIEEEIIRKHAQNIRKLIKSYMASNELDPILEANIHQLNYVVTLNDTVWQLIDEKKFPSIFNFIGFHYKMGERPKTILQSLAIEAKLKEL